MRRTILSLLMIVPALAAPVDEHTKRIQESATVLNEILDAGDKSIPKDLLEKAQCVAVVPNLKRAGFIVGAKYGKGVLTCRVPEGNGWSAVSTIRVEGGSIGLQIGAGETDLVLIVENKSGMNKLMADKFTVGGDASVMAGPVGRSADASTDAAMRAEILAYSRAHGIFAGVSLEGATLRPDSDDNRKIYGRAVSQKALLSGEVTPPESAAPLYAELNKYAPYKKASE
jgi:lipid-binding SYLF domain-containing protein